ncbi:HD domain-containing phosphohydrolase [Nautilia sp.]
MFFKVLGAYGSKSKNKNPVSFQISKNTVIDAGNILNGVENPQNIENVIISHSHIDHIQDLPYLIDLTYETRKKPLKIYATEITIRAVKEHIFNNSVWPEFSSILLPGQNKNSIYFIPITPDVPVKIDEKEIFPFRVSHTVESLGFLIDKTFLISGDTSYCENLIKTINTYRPKYVFLEVSFPERLQNIADISGHMSTGDIKNVIKNISYKPEKIYAYHIKPQFENEIVKELSRIDVIQAKENLTFKENRIYCMKHADEIIFEMIKDLYTEKDINKILNKIVTYAREITNADAATLYYKTEDDMFLEFKIIQNETLRLYMNENINWPKLPLYINKKPNTEMVAVLCALKGEIINIKDAYDTEKFNFEGTKRFDKKNGYRSKSMLVIPLKNHKNEIIGVLQLINKYSGGSIVPFEKKDQDLVYLLSSIAAVSLTKNKLIEDFEKLLSSLIKTIGTAIDEKSKYTGGHVRRVAKLALKIAKAVEKEKIKTYTEEELKMIETAGWLHDIGKIATPEYVMNKATKLHLFIDILPYVKFKFELAKAYGKIDLLEKKTAPEEYEELVKTLNEGFRLVTELNKGGEFVPDEKISALKKLCLIKINGEPLINKNEFENLSVKKGTLTERERKKIEEHASIGLKMLKQLHFPKKFKKLPSIAANHHEKLNGKGYPRGLKAKELSLEERIMAVADIFEALSAADRPYKKPKKMSEIFKILYFMAKNNELDKNIIKIILKNGVYLEYAKEELKKEQLDEIPEEITSYFFSTS